MSRPGLPGSLPAVLARDHVEFFPLVKLEFDSGTLYLSGCDFNVDYAGQIWTSLRGLGSIDVITESPDEIPGINLTLSGVPNEAIVHAQTEKYRGRRVTVLWAFFDADVFWWTLPAGRVISTCRSSRAARRPARFKSPLRTE